MDRDEADDYVFYGTPIDREEDNLSCKKKALADSAGHLRSLPHWKQEVRDEEGRRRFHGAFTGGFSAGYYNTVGSKQGWAPQSFTSSRTKRADVKRQSILNFLDEDEKSELEGGSLGLSSKFDTFGFTSAEAARNSSTVENQRPSLIPGPVPDELIVPSSDSIGVKLLVKMGWRQGTSLKNHHMDSLYDARREARKALIALSSTPQDVDAAGPSPLSSIPEEQTMVDNTTTTAIVDNPESTPVYVLNPKQNLHGLGYDPFRNAPEFRDKKRSHVDAAPGFGIGVLEEMGVEDEDVYVSSDPFSGFRDDLDTEIDDGKLQMEKGNDRCVFICRFRVASNSDYRPERFDPPTVPNDWSPYHKFKEQRHGFFSNSDGFSLAPPDEVHPPEARDLRILIEGIAGLVARSGKVLEDVFREKSRSNPLFSFLSGGDGHEYYTRRLWEGQQKHHVANNNAIKPQSVQEEGKKLTAERRGEILGEKPLERREAVALPFKLEDTFTKPDTGLQGIGKPFKGDAEKQERFERFMKEKLHGGLHSGGSNQMSESARARERLDFEAVAEGMKNEGRECKGGEMVFVSGKVKEMEGREGVKSEEAAGVGVYPAREEVQWRPFPILCKRFDIADPFMGKPTPPPLSKTKMDSLVFSLTSSSSSSLKRREREEEVVKGKEEPVMGVDGGGVVVGGDVNRPVDLYKAIFSDDSDEGGGECGEKVEEEGSRSEGANSTLNRLIAGDFLESLGKELGMGVPPETPVVSMMRDSSSAVASSSSAVASSSSAVASSFSAVASSSSVVASASRGGRGEGMEREGRLVGVSDEYERGGGRDRENGRKKHREGRRSSHYSTRGEVEVEQRGERRREKRDRKRSRME